jgi:hypothetical protein
MSSQREASVVDEAEETSPSWADEFFGESNIVHTLQILLSNTSQNIDDLCVLGTTMHKSSVLLAFTSQGMVPLAGDHMYVFPFKQMSKRQLEALEAAVSVYKDLFTCSYEHDNYIIHDKHESKVDDAVLLFGVSCIMVHGLSNITVSKFGTCTTKLEEPQVAYYVNATLFRIVNACCMPRGTLHTTERMLHRHGVVVARGAKAAHA